MAKGCGCASGTCACSLEAGNEWVSVQGSGSPTDKYRIFGTPPALQVTPSASITLSKTGSGTQTSPWNITATLNPISLDDLSNVQVAANPTNGYVLAWSTSSQQWIAVPPSTATVGAVSVGNGIGGDGSSGNPLVARLFSGGFLEFSSGQIRVSRDGQGYLGLGYASAAARDAQYTTWGISPANGHKAWLVDRSTLTVYGSGRWWEFTPEINQTWQLNRSYPGSEDLYTGTYTVLSGTLNSLPAGRYRFDYGVNQTTTNNGGFTSASQRIVVNAVTVEDVPQDASFGWALGGNHFFYTFPGGNMAITYQAYTTPGEINPVRILTAGARVLVTYMGKS